MTQHRRQSAFTLVEMLLAMALTAFLLAAISVLIGQMAASGEQMRRREAEPIWMDALLDCLRADLQMADAVSVEQNRLIIEGHRSLQSSTVDSSLPMHRPVTVTYTAREIDSIRYAVRMERDPTELSNRISHTEILAGNMTTLEFNMTVSEEDDRWRLSDLIDSPPETPEDERRRKYQPADGAGVMAASDEPIVPSQLYVRIQTRDMDSPIDRVLVVN